MRDTLRSFRGMGEVLIGSDVEGDGVKESPIGLRRHVVALFVD
jgi:hypothetical protein